MKSVFKEILNTSIYLLIVLILTFLVIKYVGQRTEVNGASMEPTLHHGDNLIVDKISYRLRDPERFDIVVFPFEHEQETYFIKRIIGMPGEEVRIDEDGVIYIDGKELNESYGKEVIQDPGLALETIELGDDEYFVLGDNRNNSTDSRSSLVGNLHRRELIGRAWVRIYPFDQMEVIKHQ